MLLFPLLKQDVNFFSSNDIYLLGNFPFFDNLIYRRDIFTCEVFIYGVIVIFEVEDGDMEDDR